MGHQVLSPPPPKKKKKDWTPRQPLARRGAMLLPDSGIEPATSRPFVFTIWPRTPSPTASCVSALISVSVCLSLSLCSYFSVSLTRSLSMCLYPSVSFSFLFFLTHSHMDTASTHPCNLQHHSYVMLVSHPYVALGHHHLRVIRMTRADKCSYALNCFPLE